ncbi:MAG TPA: glucan biosynthesis protein [Kiritimatiellia bacterium]|nr:glucan biosynthesis protein [Kiritimatiellia bacterium]
MRIHVLSACLVAVSLLPRVVHAGQVLDYDHVREMARSRAQAPYRDDRPPLPRKLRDLDYDDLRAIRFDPREALWRMERLPFQAQFFHPGGIQSNRVTVNWFEGEVIETVPFTKSLFDYSKVDIGRSVPDDIGFAGFRLHYPLNRPDYLDEVVAFQGASYFRALGAGQRYGLSARGVAVNVATEAPEEFPRFTEFWLEKPDRDATRIRLFALLDSPSMVGAFSFLIIPDRTTVMEIEATLFMRTNVSMLGLAPLTSMFWFGENSWLQRQDFRPEVHDSDGLLVHTGADEWLWRPLENEARLRFASFVDNNPRGFGLFQRDRRFSSYEDLEADYHLRPSLWVEPVAPFGEGEIRLIEIPSETEYNDNVVACWVPRRSPAAGDEINLHYRLHWLMDSGAHPPLARAIATRQAAIPYLPGARKFVVDFAGTHDLENASEDALAADISAANAEVLGQTLQRNPHARSWRAVFDVKPVNPELPIELRCFLKTDQKPLTETWTYLWLP